MLGGGGGYLFSLFFVCVVCVVESVCVSVCVLNCGREKERGREGETGSFGAAVVMAGRR